MAFDQQTRAGLQRMVAGGRRLLTEEFIAQMQSIYGIQPGGNAAEISVMAHLDDDERETAGLLRERLRHIESGPASAPAHRAEAVARLVREQAFTVINRFAAMRMAEERGIILESVANGMRSRGFKVYEQTAGSAMGPTYERYKTFIYCLWDELAVDLGALFDRYSPFGLLFPREKCLENLFELLNDPVLAPLWKEDETIGWIYQYFNSKEEREAMRKASQAPRDSRELAVRNQFFTPRYVVEFLTDNTLGRTWYEMTRGNTALAERCRYLVRRPNEIFLQPGETPPPLLEARPGKSQEELLREPVYIPCRPVKDPREILMLDPACGSMHFGLYAFDLYETIYEEAWDFYPLLLLDLRETCAGKEEFLRQVPGLIIRHNIHGIDIDPRAVQIANLSLWLRAQNSWKKQGLKPAQRPPITRSQVVCAEPMPGEKHMLEEFIKSLNPPVLGSLVRLLWEKMQMAGEAGALLKIEEEISAAIEAAKKEWLDLTTDGEERIMFKDFAPPRQKVFKFPVFDVKEDFWQMAEKRVLDALEKYAESAGAGESYQRRLFVDDAARGFAFIDLCRKKYDVVLMNPPFGSPGNSAGIYFLKKYPNCKEDIDAAFVERGVNIICHNSLLGAIINRTQFFKGVLKNWREEVFLKSCNFESAADFGYGVLDALVETAAYILRKPKLVEESYFFRLLSVEDKGPSLLSLLNSLKSRDSIPSELYYVASSEFLQFPEARIAYWAGNSIKRAYKKFPPLEGSYGTAKQGLITADNFRFLRLAWEINEKKNELVHKKNIIDKYNGQKKWFYYPKGGEYSPYFGDIHLMVNWESDGIEIKNLLDSKGLQASRPQNIGYYFKPALTYTERTASGFSPRAMPAGCIFDCKGPIIYPNDISIALPMLGILMSRVFALFIELSVASGDSVFSGSAARQYTQGIVGSIPIPAIDEPSISDLQYLVESIWTLNRDQDSGNETSRYFMSLEFFLLLSKKNDSILQQCIEYALYQKEERILDIIKKSWKVERIVRDMYILDEKCLEEIDNEFGSHPEEYPKNPLSELEEKETLRFFLKSIDDVIDEKVNLSGGSRILTKKCYFANRRIEILSVILQRHPVKIVEVRRKNKIIHYAFINQHIHNIISYSFGVILGRWDIRITLDPSLAPALAGPFDPLPVCPPGMLIGEDGLPAQSGGIVSEEWLRARPNAITLPPTGTVKNPTIPDHNYPLRISWEGILVEDSDAHAGQDHQEDILQRTREVLRLLWGEKAFAVEQEICAALEIKDLKTYLQKPTGFFQDHLKRYSKSRRQAPIYWPLSTASGTYTLWIYYHRLDEQTLYKCVMDFLEPKIAAVEQRIAARQAEMRDSAKLAERQGLEKELKFLEELKEFKSEMLVAAGLPYKPDLNDGVLVTAAPLWRMFRHPKWRKDLEQCWQKLEKGEYDWAHIAYTIWPERVREKCKKDKSIAIAHGLEELYEEPRSQARKRKG